MNAKSLHATTLIFTALLIGCSPVGSRTAKPPVELTADDLEPVQETVNTSSQVMPDPIDQACGNPIAYPVSASCVSAMGKYGPVVQRRSDLVMAVKTACAPSPESFSACMAKVHHDEPSCKRAKKDRAAKRVMTVPIWTNVQTHS